MASYLPIHDKSILIVDDNATNLLLMEAILEEEGFHNTHTVSSAIEAYDVLENEDINIMLMDIMMPEIDGLEATEAIKANPKYSHVPIVMVTATDDDETLKKSFELGAVDFVRKPVNQVELIARITTILQSQEKDDFIIQHSRFDVMEEIIGMLAHQWRQPLSIISAIVGTMQTQKELSILSDEDLTTSLQNISEHTNELSQMITTFREFFKTDDTPSLTDPNDAIREAKELMKEDLQQHHITLTLTLGEMEPIFYTQNLLIQVLTNLIANSREAFERNKITENAQISIRSFFQNNKINVLVEDNAGGIDKDIIEYIFEPYYSTKTEKNGKGLGLYLAKSILTQQLQGNISVTSQDDKSKFLITFRPTEKK
jgi:signal transduction histidine kinase